MGAGVYINLSSRMGEEKIYLPLLFNVDKPCCRCSKEYLAIATVPLAQLLTPVHWQRSYTIFLFLLHLAIRFAHRQNHSPERRPRDGPCIRAKLDCNRRHAKTLRGGLVF